MIELVRAEKRVKTFTNSVNDLKKSWENGNLDESVDVVEVSFNDQQFLKSSLFIVELIFFIFILLTVSASDMA